VLLVQNATQVFPFFEIPTGRWQLIGYCNEYLGLNSVGLPPSCLLTWWATPRWPAETKHLRLELPEEHRRILAINFPRFNGTEIKNHLRDVVPGRIFELLVGAAP